MSLNDLIIRLKVDFDFDIKGHIRDILPLSRRQLGAFISDDEKRTEFLGLQKLYLLNVSAHNYPWLLDGQLPPFTHEEVLGRGATLGVVKKASHVFNGKQYARRRLHLDIPGEIGKVREQLRLLKTYAGNRHIAQVEGCFCEPSESMITVLLHPVADCNLNEYLEKFHTLPDQEKEKSNLYRLFGCLLMTLKNMYQEDFPKKSIKPQSILIHGSNVLFTGFRVDARLTEDGPGIDDQSNAKKYEAPELLEVSDEPTRDVASDLFSLGCVFLEVLTVLTGKRLEDLRRNEKSLYDYGRHIERVHDWWQMLAEEDTKVDDKRLVLPFELCSQLLAHRVYRPGIKELILKMAMNIPQGVSLNDYFCIDCCRDFGLLVLESLVPNTESKFLSISLKNSKYDSG
jgi:serine/threonine protein kinase